MNEEHTPILLTPVKREELFNHGLELFNSEKFFKAHEAWEVLWKFESAQDKEFIQGLIVLCGHFVQTQKHNWSGAIKLCDLAFEKLKLPPKNSLYKKYDLSPLFSALDYNKRTLSQKELAEAHVLSPENLLYPKLLEK